MKQYRLIRHWLLIPLVLLFLSRAAGFDKVDQLKETPVEITEPADQDNEGNKDSKEENKNQGDQDEYMNPNHHLFYLKSEVRSSNCNMTGDPKVQYFDIHTPPPERMG